MLQYLKDEANVTYTENGAVTNRSSFSHCVDLFGTIGALRKAGEEDIRNRFMHAYTENPDIAMKILFYARDVRGGLGERRVFRICMDWLANNHLQSVQKNVGLIAEYGRWDDVTALLHTPCRAAAAEVIARQFRQDMNALTQDGDISLLGKWLPSVNASNSDTVKTAKLIAREVLHLSDRDYRKALVALRARIRIIENNLRQKDYSFDYSKQPSKAMFKYRRAFIRNDEERYRAFMERVKRGEAKLHADTLMPYEFVDPYLNSWFTNHCFMRSISEAEKQVLNATWASLPDYGTNENALAVVDTSGSMYCYTPPSPASVALSLGLYFAEHSSGAFANHFIEFSERPRLIELKGETFADRLRYIASFNEIGNTNIEAVFDLILDAAVKNHVPQSELPAKLYIISDMEFDACVRHSDITNFTNAARKYHEAGYQLPALIFWNVASRNEQQPVTVNDKGVALVSGCSPRIFSMVMDGELSPYAFMLQAINTERYSIIAA